MFYFDIPFLHSESKGDLGDASTPAPFDLATEAMAEDSKRGLRFSPVPPLGLVPPFGPSLSELEKCSNNVSATLVFLECA